MEYFTLKEIQHRLRILTADRGAKKRMANFAGVSPTEISQTLAGIRRPSYRLLKALGLKRLELYVRINP